MVISSPVFTSALDTLTCLSCASLTALSVILSRFLSLPDIKLISISEWNELLMHPILASLLSSPSLPSLFPPCPYLHSPTWLPTVCHILHFCFIFSPAHLWQLLSFSLIFVSLGLHCCHGRSEAKAPELTAVQRNGRRCGRRVHNNLCMSPSDPCSGILTTGKRNISLCSNLINELTLWANPMKLAFHIR